MRSDTRLVFGSIVWCSNRDMPNGLLEPLREIKRLFRCTAGHPDPAIRVRLLSEVSLKKKNKQTTVSTHAQTFVVGKGLI